MPEAGKRDGEITVNLIPEVAKMVNRPFSEKLLETQGLMALNIGKFRDDIAVAFSGGKDSLLVVHFALLLKPDIKIVFNNTNVEYPETVKFVNWLVSEWNLNLTITDPIMSFWDCVDRWGFTTGKATHTTKKKNAHCCYYLKEKPMLDYRRENGIKAQFTGITAVENRNRMFSAKQYGWCFYSKSENIQKVHPLMWWTPNEVLEYIADMGIPNNPLYARGMDRVGCMPCTAFKTWEPQLQKFNPKMYAIIKLRKDKQYVMPEAGG